MHQTHEFASRENEGAFVLMLGHLLVLAPVVGVVLEVEPSERVGAKDEVVAAVDVADLSQVGVLRDEAPRRALVPGQTKILSEVLVFREAVDIDDLGQDASGDDRAKALDGDDGVGNGVDGTSDLLVKSSQETLDEADVIPDSGQGKGDHVVKLRLNGVGRAQCLLDGSSSGVRVIEVSPAATSDEVGELVVGQVA